MSRLNTVLTLVVIVALVLLVYLFWPSAGRERMDRRKPSSGDQLSTIVAFSAQSAADVSSFPALESHQYRIHLIDVGTGLAILVQGRAFNLLYDGGSRDDKRGLGKESSSSRLLAYLYAAIGASGPEKCRPKGDEVADLGARHTTIDHLILSHPHEDHGNYFDEILFCYSVENVWDVGIVNNAKFYKQFLSAVAAEPNVNYRTVAAPSPGNCSPPIRRRWRIVALATHDSD